MCGRFVREIEGETISAVPAVFGSLVKIAFGGLSGKSETVLNNSMAPVREVVQPVGRAGAVTASKFSLKTTIEGTSSSLDFAGALCSHKIGNETSSSAPKLRTDNLR